jgi:hypothetical protein
MTDTIVISDRFRTPTTVQRREKGGLLVRQGGRYVVLDAAGTRPGSRLCPR